MILGKSVRRLGQFLPITSGCGIIWEGLVLSISNTEHCWQSSLGFTFTSGLVALKFVSDWSFLGGNPMEFQPQEFFFFQILEKMISFALRFHFTSFGSPRWPPSYTWSGCLHGSYHSLEIVIDFSDCLVTLCFLHYPVSLTGSGWFCSVVSGTQ